MNLPPELYDYQVRIRDLAAGYGLDFPEVIFELLDYEQLNAVAAYGGFPTRYPHWRHGMDYEQISQGHRYGMSKIYELVINTSPCYAYLLSSNSLVDNKLVMAHVYGHADFFKNNRWFARTDRKMMDVMANHATKVRRLIDKHGQERVDDFLDRCLSLENQVDLHAEFAAPDAFWLPPAVEEEAEDEVNFKLRSRDYMDPFINPPEVIERRKRRHAEEREKERRMPGGAQRDLPGFLLRHAPLERWEWELLRIVRDEAIYFAPQRMTKIMNEGWATYWHRRIMVENVLLDEELVDYADVCAGTLAEGKSLNPYKLGLELWLDIEERWNTGRHGLDYERCDDLVQREAWDTKAMAGQDQIFLCRKIHNDVTFIDEYLTEDFCHRHKLFTYRYDPQTGQRRIVTRDFKAVKEQLLKQLANGGAPVIEAVDLNYQNRGELYLKHRSDDQDLRVDWAERVLDNLAALWKRPVHLESRREGKLVVHRCDAPGIAVESQVVSTDEG